MKKFLSLLLIIAILSVTLTLFLSADKYNGLEYTFIGPSSARVDSGFVSGTLDLTDFVSGYNVTEIRTEAFAYNDGIDKVILPEGLHVIGRHAFLGCSSIKEVVIPDSTMYIRKGAFSECSSLRNVVIPSTVIEIGEDVFSYCSPSLTVGVYSGSYAFDYCIENNINYTLLDKNCSHQNYGVSIPISPDCKNEGTLYDKCITCGKLFNKRSLSATGHSFGKWVVNSEGRKRTCNICNKVESNFNNDYVITKPFIDVSGEQWFYKAVGFCVYNGLFSGTSTTTFEPDTGMTRAMFVTVLGAMTGVDTSLYNKSSFTDVALGQWYTPYIEWAFRNKIVSGYGDKFGYNDLITREQMAVMMKSYAAFRGFDITVENENILEPYTDKSIVSSWAKDAMIWAVNNGLISGTAETTLSPQFSAIRAQVAQIIYKFANRFEPQIEKTADYQRVVIFGIDGGGDLFGVNMPNVERIFNARTYTAKAEIPTISSENWGAILHGVSADVHGITNDTILDGPFATRSLPSIMRLVRGAYPESTLAAFCTWSNLYKGLIEGDIGVYTETTPDDAPIKGQDTDLTGQVINYINDNDPKMLFIQFDNCDTAGHNGEGGYNGQLFKDQLKLTDSLIGGIYDKYVDLGRADDTLFICVTDHGGTVAGTHGGSSPAETNVFLGVGGRTVNTLTLNDMKNRDVAAIALEALGIDIPPIYTAKVPQGLFID